MEVISSIYNSGYNIKKFYLGSRELNLAYLGNQVIYDEVIGDNDLNYILYEFYGSDTLPNTVEAPVKSAILKGSTKYRDIDTGEFLETFEEGRNLELVSVKMPVLTTVGKNLLNPNTYTIAWGVENLIKNDDSFTLDITEGWGGIQFKDLKLKPNTNYTFKFETNKSTVIGFAKISGQENQGGKTEFTFTTDNTGLITLTIEARNPTSSIILSNIQLEEGDIATTYEPYKSNILTISEETELHGIGGVKDELNLITGELTQRIGKMIIDGRGEFKWGYGWNSYGTSYPLDNPTILDNYNFKKDKNLICEQLPILDSHNYNDRAGIVPDVNRRGIVLVVPNELTGGPNNVDGLRTWLNENPLTVFYEFNTDSVKTVDLTIVDQDGKTINKLNSFNGTTHISTEVAENSAYPMVSLEVASELQAAMSKVAEDIELIKPVQNDIETTIDTQSNDIDSLLLATTELFEMFL